MIRLDDTTRAGRMLASGRVTVTFRSKVSGDHITLTAKCRAPNDKGKWVACSAADAKIVFISVPGADGGWDDKVAKVTKGKGLVRDPGTDEARFFCARQLLALVAGDPLPDALEAQEEDRCGKCGRALTDPVSIERGIGPECFGKATGSKHQTKGAMPGAPLPGPTAEQAEGAEAAMVAAEIAADSPLHSMVVEEAYAAHAATLKDGASIPAPQLFTAPHDMDLDDPGLKMPPKSDGKDGKNVPFAVGDWRARQDFAAARKDDPAVPEISSQLTSLPGVEFEDIFEGWVYRPTARQAA